MATYQRANFAETTLGAAILDDDDTAITVASGASFPAVPFLVTIGTEILKCTDKGAGTNWTVTRGEQSSVAAAHDNGTTVQNNITAGDFSPLVEGPASVASDGNLAIYNGTTGKIIKDGGTVTAAGLALLDDANAAAQIATLGLDADIATLSLPASTTITAAGAALIDDATATVQIATLGLDADIATLSLPANTTITAAGAALIDDANAAAQLATLGALPLAGGTMSGNIVMGDGGTIGQAAGPLLTFDDTLNYLKLTGAFLSVGVSGATSILYVYGASEAYTGTGTFRFLTSTGTADVGMKITTLAGAGAAGYVAFQGIHVGVANDANICLNPGLGNVGIGTLAPLSELCINGGLHVGGDSDAGDNNLLVDGTGTITGAFGCNGTVAQTGYANAPWDEPGAGAFGVDSAAHMAALVELVQDIQAALVANGILATPA